MNKGELQMSAEKSGTTTSDGTWDLRNPGLVMKDGEREVHEFTGMWPLKPDADLVKFTKTLAFREFWNPPQGSALPTAQRLKPLTAQNVRKRMQAIKAADHRGNAS